MKKEAAEVILTRLVQDTPVDTSAALSNYNVTSEFPTPAIFPAVAPGVAGSTFSTSSQATIGEGVGKISSSKPGQSIFISNFIDYLQYLNDGSSVQAPAGFVETSVLKGRLLIRDKGVSIND